LRFRMLINKDTLCVGCSGNWLLFQDYMYRPSRYYLKNPLRGATMRLPEHCREPVHLNPDGSYGRRSSSRSTDFRIRKVIICSRDLVVAKANYQCHPRAVVVCCKPSTSSTLPIAASRGTRSTSTRPQSRRVPPRRTRRAGADAGPQEAGMTEFTAHRPATCGSP